MKTFESYGLAMLSKRATGILALALCGQAAALPSQEWNDSLANKLEDIESRRGLEVGGNIRSYMVTSAFSSDQDVNGNDVSPDTERDGFAQLDLKLGFRPWAETRANLVLRMSSNYQDFFNAGAKQVYIPWVNMEGQVSDKFYWVAGDFRQQYSPLSMYSPDIEVLYEPEIYRRTRHMARDQVYLQGNQRNLQGANLQYRDSFGETVGEIRAEAMLSRLRRYEVLDFSGAMGNIIPNEQNTPGASQSSGMDKMLYGGNFEWFPMQRKLMLGVTPLFIKDLASTRTGVWRMVTDEETGEQAYEYQDVNPGVLGAENSQAISFRFGADGGAFIGDSSFILDLTAEYSMSKDEGFKFNDEGAIVARDFDGAALLAQLSVGYKAGSTWDALAKLNYMQNDSSWFNPLAQSPSFFARRIMNSDKDKDLLRFGAASPLYSTFDAVYHFVPKFSPVSTTLVADPTAASQTESYNIAPFSKNSWGTSVYTRDELSLVNTLADEALQSTLPNGLASSNRVGPQVQLVAGLGEKHFVEAQFLFATLEEVKATRAEKAKFGELGGGAKVDAGHFMGFGLPLELSGSYKQTTREQGATELTSDFINGGLYARFHKRFGVAAGVQMINSTWKDDVTRATDWILAKGDQMQWMAGIDYSLAPNAWLAINVGQINVTNTYETAADGVSATESVMLPSYIVAEMEAGSAAYAGKKSFEHSFSQNLVEASINVDF